jgi:low temperature requirement protein LtrA
MSAASERSGAEFAVERPEPGGTGEMPMAEPETAEKRGQVGGALLRPGFVFAVTEVSGLLHHHHDWGGVLRALVVFVPIWWAWVGTSVHANTHDVDNPVDRIGIFAVGLCSLFMALAVGEAYGDRGLLFGVSYLAIRILLGALVFGGGKITSNAFSVGVFVTGPLLVTGGLLHGGLAPGALGPCRVGSDISRLAPVKAACGVAEVGMR